MNEEDPKPESEPPKEKKPDQEFKHKCTACKYPLLKDWHFCPECGMVTGR